MNFKNYLNISNKQNIDAGMALILISLLMGVFFNNKLGILSLENIYFKIASVLLLVNMIVPKTFYFFSVFWFAFSEIMGTIMSKVILTVIFYIIVLPIALIRQIFGVDNLFLKKYNENKKSVFKSRDTTFKSTDLHHPY